jgi:hypothetical protein
MEDIELIGTKKKRCVFDLILFSGKFKLWKKPKISKNLKKKKKRFFLIQSE